MTLGTTTCVRSSGGQARCGAGLAVGVLALLLVPGAAAQSLRGSSASLDRQNREAHLHDFTYLSGPGQLQRFVAAGLLVPVEGNAHYVLHGVSYGVARPEVRLFIERLAAQYHRACREPLVVTSLTRPISAQPSNASSRSVHPTGMAIDLRRPASSTCRSWLSSTLLALERARVLEATLETSPPHFHVAIFPTEYVSYVARLTRRTEPAVLAAASRPAEHTVRRGETLWRIAGEYGTTPDAIRLANGLRSNLIRPGQVLELPSSAVRQ